MPDQPARDILDILCELSHRMTHHGGKIPGDILERTAYFSSHTDLGKTCAYYLKYRDMFMKHDYQDVRRLILEASEYIRRQEEEQQQQEKPK
jgi:hypothetical protein